MLNNVDTFEPNHATHHAKLHELAATFCIRQTYTIFALNSEIKSVNKCE